MLKFALLKFNGNFNRHYAILFHNFACYDFLVFFVLDHLQFCCGFIEKLHVYNKLNSITSVYLNAY